MRDLILIAIVGSGSLVALRRPWIGVILWTWISVMNPHQQYGWHAANWPVASIVAICTLLGLLLTKDRQTPFLGVPVWALLAFTLWICVTLPFSIHLDLSLPLWERSMKVYLMIFVTLALVNTRQKLDWLVWTGVVSLGFYGVKGGLFTLATGGNYRVWGPGGFIEGNNELALALVMIIPLMRYLQMQTKRRWLSIFLGGSMILTSITVLGTHSRGALLAIMAMIAFLWWKTERKFAPGLAILAIGVLISRFMPDHWWARMETIRTFDEDASAMGRINAWWAAWNLASDRFFGGGFMAWTDTVFRIYAPIPEDVHAAHSIYFQVLGEHGFVGLLLFLAIGALTWRAARRLASNRGAKSDDKWAADLGAMVQVSMVGYAVGGSFLSLAYFDLPYNMMVAVVIATNFVCGRADPRMSRPASILSAPHTLRREAHV